MSPEELKNLWVAIHKTQELFKTRSGTSDWQRNIVDGSSSLKTKIEWSNFYAWLANPSQFIPKENEEDFKFEEDCELWKNYKYPEGVHEKIFKNGNETMIHIVNDKWYANDAEEDEKEMKN